MMGRGASRRERIGEVEPKSRVLYIGFAKHPYVKMFRRLPGARLEAWATNRSMFRSAYVWG